MKYRVRTKDGALEYESWAQLQSAASTGFVEADDEIQSDDHPTWRKAADVKGLMGKLNGPPWWRRPLVLWVGLAVVGEVFALWTMRQPDGKIPGVVLAFLIVGVLFKVTADAHRRRR